MPDIAEWYDKLNAWGTLAAVFVALFVAVNEGRRRRLDKEDVDAGQARLITVQRYHAGVEITNHSLAPILTLKLLKLQVIDGSTEGWEGLTNTVDEEGLLAEVLAPGESVRVHIQQFRRPRTTVVNLQRRLQKSDKVICTFSLTDAQGLKWRKQHQSQPERILERRARRFILRRR